MKQFNSLGAFAEHLLKASLAVAAGAKVSLTQAAKVIQTEAKKEIGHLQPSVGPFPAWAELADSTKKDKERLGYVFNEDYNPLYRTGELRDSIQYEVSAFEAIIGSTDPIMAYQEFGTVTIPPRPVLGPAAFKSKEKIFNLLGSTVMYGLSYGVPITFKAGYSLEEINHV